MAARRGRGDGSIYQLPDGRWRAMIDLGVVNGQRKRKAATRATRREAAAWLRDALRAREAGGLVSRTPTVAEWFATYLREVAPQKVRPSTLVNYQHYVTAHLTPTLGRRRLDGLGPEHLATLYAAKLAEGLSPSSIRYLHAVIRRGLAIAVRWDLVARNVATLVDPPEVHHVEIEPLTPSEARAFLTAARSSPMEARWVVGLSLGLRQSEALGLRWEDVDLDRGVLRVRRQLLRRRAKGESLLFGPLKSRRSRRVLSVPALLVDLLREHKTRQEAARRRAGSRWADERVVFATSLGRPIEHRNDTRAFKALCRRAGLRAVRLHDLRHTAASLLLAQGQHPQVVMEVLGHSQISLTMNTYSHVMPSLLRDAADAMTEALWNEDESA